MSHPHDRASSPRRPHFGGLDIHASPCRQLAERLGGEVVRSHRTDWHSVTFAGARHQVVLRTAASREVLEALPDHEFALPGAFVADLELVETDGDLVTVEALVVRD